jgi:5'-3' exonuclease
MNRILWIDFSVFQFRAIFGAAKNKDNKIPATYSCMSMILASLKELQASQEDTIIIACDSPKGSWRKDYDSDYKGNRKAKRDTFDIDWKGEFEQFKNLKTNLSFNTTFIVLEGDKLEADDIIAYGVRYFASNPCIIVSTDSDYEQLTCYKNVRVFSPVSKKFKIVTNPYKLLAKKIEQERTDNLMSPILTEADYNKRKMLVDLTTLPDFVEKQTKEMLDKAMNCDIIREFRYEGLKHKSLHQRYIALFSKPKEKKQQMELL